MIHLRELTNPTHTVCGIDLCHTAAGTVEYTDSAENAGAGLCPKCARKRNALPPGVSRELAAAAPALLAALRTIAATTRICVCAHCTRDAADGMVELARAALAKAGAA